MAAGGRSTFGARFVAGGVYASGLMHADVTHEAWSANTNANVDVDMEVSA